MEHKERKSGIELLKIVGIALIVLSHVTQTLSSGNTYISYQDYVLNLKLATTNVQYLMLAVFRYSGALGNAIFFICSAWFLLDSDKFSKEKWLFLLTQIWCISVLILAVTFVLRGGDINAEIIIKSIFPTTFSNNWYMTCYLLFYPLHPILNKIIKSMQQKALLKTVTVLLVLYIGFNFIRDGLFFANNFTIWIALYFAMAYMKRYLPDMLSDVKLNITILILAFCGHIGIILTTNFLGFYIGFFSNQVLRWVRNSNPFLILMTLSLFNLVRSTQWKNSFVNRISGLSMLVYIIHENIILRTYYRPWLINYIYESFGYSHILLWILLLAAIIFLLSVCVSLLYTVTLQKIIKKISDKLYALFDKIYAVYETNILKLH